jgi:hypothetical protein
MLGYLAILKLISTMRYDLIITQNNEAIFVLSKKKKLFLK